MASVNLLNGKAFDASPFTSLLDSAIAQNIVLEYSCKTGRCGVCKAKVDGVTSVIQNEAALSELEVEQGYVLTCCRAAVSDIQLHLEDLPELAGLKPKTIPCRVDSKRLLNASVLEVVLRTPPSSTLNFLAGQHLSVIGPSGLRRSYSIANFARNDGKIELQIKKVEGGLFSKIWFEEIAVNDLLRVEGPLGSFFIRSNPVDHLVFLATGTGVAPVKAMVEQLAQQASSKMPLPKISVFFGARFSEDLYWSPSQETLQLLDLSFHPVVSRPDPSWCGAKGHVQAVFLNHAQQHGIGLANTAVYACGSDQMIDTAKSQLVQAGLPLPQFYSDAFVSTSS